MSSPDVASSRPVITLSRVVLPLPLGPTNIVSSPRWMSRSMPRRAWTCVSPRPNTFVTSREKTAIPSVFMRSTSKNHRGFEHQNAADAHQACQSNHEEHDHRDAYHDLPRENDPARRQIVHGGGKEGRGHPHAKGVAGGANNRRLQQDHRDDPPVGHADGLQCAKLFQVLDGEDVEGLSWYDGTHNQGDHHGDAKVHGDAGVLQVETECVPGKFSSAPCSQSSGRFNSPANLFEGHSGGGLGENEGEQSALATHKPERLAVARVKDGEALKRRRCVADPDNQDPPLVHLKRLACLKGLAREEIHEPRLVNDGRVRPPQVINRASQHPPRSPHKGRIVYTQENYGAELSVWGFRAAQAFVERDRPLHPGHTADSIKVVIPQGIYFIAVERLGIHHPDISVHNVLNLTGGPRHDANENGDLIG